MVEKINGSPIDQQSNSQIEASKFGRLNGKKVSLVYAGILTTLALTAAVVATIFSSQLVALVSAMAFFMLALSAVLINRVKVSQDLIEHVKSLSDQIDDFNKNNHSDIKGELEKAKESLSASEQTNQAQINLINELQQKLSFAEQQLASGKHQTLRAEDQLEEQLNAGPAIVPSDIQQELEKTKESLSASEQANQVQMNLINELQEKLKFAEQQLATGQYQALRTEVQLEEQLDDAVSDKEEQELEELFGGYSSEQMLELLNCWDLDEQERVHKLFEEMIRKDALKKAMNNSVRAAPPPPPPPGPLLTSVSKNTELVINKKNADEPSSNNNGGRQGISTSDITGGFSRLRKVPTKNESDESAVKKSDSGKTWLAEIPNGVSRLKKAGERKIKVLEKEEDPNDWKAGLAQAIAKKFRNTGETEELEEWP